MWDAGRAGESRASRPPAPRKKDPPWSLSPFSEPGSGQPAQTGLSSLNWEPAFSPANIYLLVSVGEFSPHLLK